MKLSQMASKPQLIEVVIKDKDIVKKYGEQFEFYTWDRQPLDMFMKMSAVNEQNPAAVFPLVRELILDEHGKPIVEGEITLPTDLLVKAILTITQKLGG